MSADIYRRCGCRKEDGRAYGSLPDRATTTQKAAACPRMLADARHGSWGFVVYGGTDHGTGKRVQVRRMGFATKREAQVERAKVVEQVNTGKYRTPDKTTLDHYLTAWLDRRERDGLRPSTVLGYRRYIRQDIAPAIGHVRVAELQRHHVSSLIACLVADGRGATTIRRVHATLSSALTDAVRDGLIDENPAKTVRLPKVEKEKFRMWEPDEVRAFEQVVAAHPLGALFEFVLKTGLRRGEVAGLKWSDIDLVNAALVVRQQRVQLGAQVVEGRAKTEKGDVRRVRLGAEAVGALLAWRLQQDAWRAEKGVLYQDSGWVFTYDDGRPLRPAHISRVFEKLMKQSGLPRLRFHDLRHQHASLLLLAGVPIEAVSKRLGHSTIAITLDTYSHLLDDLDRKMADAVTSVLPPRAPIAHTEHTPEGI